ncbi:MAG: hypothetical protein KBA31_14780 [Alphaproteobacteria bacterium]|nr:hypothetical protein [Alphaproteobacteria bacterium]
MHDQDFEALCTDLAERQPGIIRAELKQTKGVRQFGVDVEAFSETQQPVLVISCKRYQAISVQNVRDWGSDFLKHWDGHWKSRGVKRFVLAVSVPLNDDDLNEVFRKEATRFEERGVAYEPWGTQKLTTLLREAPEIIAAHFPTGWRETIAGYEPQATSALAPSDVGSKLRFEVFETRVDQFAEKLTAQISTNIDSALMGLREGKKAPLSILLEGLRKDRVAWDALSEHVKARALRAEAVLSLVDNDVSAAAWQLTQADAFEAAADRTHWALLKLREVGPSDALKALTPPQTQREWELFLAMVLESRGPLDFMTESEGTTKWVVTAEVLRLKAIALCLLGRDGDALLAIRGAREKAANNAAVTFAFAVIHFLLSLSTKVTRQFGNFPNPIHPSLARESDEAHSLRVTARETFDHLIACSDYQVADIEVWKAAVLLCDKRMIHDGVELLGSLVKRTYPHPGAIAWAMAYGVRFNYRKVRQGLEVLLSGANANASQLVALATILLGEGKANAAKKALERYAAQFNGRNDKALIDFWREQLSPASTTNPWPRFHSAVAQLEENSGELLATVELDDTPPEQVISATELLLKSRQAAVANKLRRKLLEIGTADACELAARAAYAAGEFESTHQIASDSAPLFPNKALPHRLRALSVDALRRSGHVGAAIKSLEAFATETNEHWANVELAKLRVSIGDIIGADRELSSILDTGTLEAREMLAIANVVRVVSPDTAKRLVKVASTQNLDEDALASAFLLAGQLNLRDVEQALAPVFESKAQAGQLRSVRVFESLEEALQQAREIRDALDSVRSAWLRGTIPVHLAFDAWPSSFLDVVMGRISEAERFNLEFPPLLRVAIPARAPVNLPHGAVLQVDLTALILAARLRILDAMSQTFQVWVPTDLPVALIQLEESIEDGTVVREDQLTLVLQRLRSGATVIAESQPLWPRLALPDDAGKPDDLLRRVLTVLGLRGIPAAEPLIKRYGISLSDSESVSEIRLELDGGTAIALAVC